MNGTLITMVQNGSVPESAVDDSVSRILLQMFIMGVIDREHNGLRARRKQRLRNFVADVAPWRQGDTDLHPRRPCF